MDVNKKLAKIKQSGVIQIRGKDVTTYESKLDYAHQIGIRSLDVDILQYPTEQNGQICFCKARLETEDGKVFSDIADASPNNVPSGCADSFPRIASTRAKSRVLSDAFNIKSVVSDCSDISPCEVVMGNIIEADFSPVEPMQRQALPDRYDGGGSKAASDKQLALIKSIVESQGGSPNETAIDLCGKNLDQLQGADANMIIRRLKKS